MMYVSELPLSVTPADSMTAVCDQCQPCLSSEPQSDTMRLLDAVVNGHDQCVETMIMSGADVNRWFVNGTPLIAAVHKGGNKCAKLLIEAGANVNKTDVNGTPLLAIAARNRNYHCVNLLLEAGADVNKALTKCALRNDVQMVKTMFSIGAKINLSNSYGQNIMGQYIRRYKSYNRTMVLLLYAAGETLDDTTFQRIRTSNPIWITDFNRQPDAEVILSVLCRRTIRNHLLDLDPHTNLFYRVPKLGLPQLLSSYLVFNFSIPPLHKP